MHIINTTSFDNRLKNGNKYKHEFQKNNLSISSALNDYLIPSQTLSNQSNRTAGTTTTEFSKQVSIHSLNKIQQNLVNQNSKTQNANDKIDTMLKHLKYFDEACDGAQIKLLHSIEYIDRCRDACELQGLEEMIEIRDLLVSKKNL